MSSTVYGARGPTRTIGSFKDLNKEILEKCDTIDDLAKFKYIVFLYFPDSDYWISFMQQYAKNVDDPRRMAIEELVTVRGVITKLLVMSKNKSTQIKELDYVLQYVNVEIDKRMAKLSQ